MNTGANEIFHKIIATLNTWNKKLNSHTIFTYIFLVVLDESLRHAEALKSAGEMNESVSAIKRKSVKMC